MKNFVALIAFLLSSQVFATTEKNINISKGQGHVISEIITFKIVEKECEMQPYSNRCNFKSKNKGLRYDMSLGQQPILEIKKLKDGCELIATPHNSGYFIFAHMDYESELVKQSDLASLIENKVRKCKYEDENLSDGEKLDCSHKLKSLEEKLESLKPVREKYEKVKAFCEKKEVLRNFIKEVNGQKLKIVVRRYVPSQEERSEIQSLKEKFKTSSK